jgi:hypothetical protein
MSHGSMAMMLKQNPSLPSGSRHIRRRCGKVGATSRPCWRFFNNEGVVHQEYTPPGQTITKEYYIVVLCQVTDAVRRKWPQLWESGDWQLHQNNVPTHSLALMLAFLAEHCISQVYQPPCSPDLAPSNFWLFPKLKSPLKGRRFVKATVTQYTSSLNSISQLTD